MNKFMTLGKFRNFVATVLMVDSNLFNSNWLRKELVKYLRSTWLLISSKEEQGDCKNNVKLVDVLIVNKKAIKFLIQSVLAHLVISSHNFSNLGFELPAALYIIVLACIENFQFPILLSTYWNRNHSWLFYLCMLKKLLGFCQGIAF